jgi:hypothetical protein
MTRFWQVLIGPPVCDIETVEGKSPDHLKSGRSCSQGTMKIAAPATAVSPRPEMITHDHQIKIISPSVHICLKKEQKS